MSSADTYQMRETCRACGSTDGRIETRGGQDCVYCQCGAWVYNAPRTETGRAVYSLASRPDITPSQRSRVLAAHDYRCVGCGRDSFDVVLHLGHLISLKDAEEHGFIDDPVVHSEWNLAPMCAECNSGLGPTSVGVRLMYRLLLIKATPK